MSAGKKEFGCSGNGISFSKPSKGTEYQDYIELVQLDSNKEWKKFRCLFNMNGEAVMREYCYFPKFLVCDVDSDEKSELVAYHDGSGSLRQRIVVYRLIDEAPGKYFSIVP